MNFFKIDEKLKKLEDQVEQEVIEKFEEANKIAYLNEEKVLKAFIDCKISSSHFVETTGYGYCDTGLKALDKVYSKIFKAEDALVRANFISGTHAIAVALLSVLKPSDELLFATGKPYSTIEKVIGKEKNKVFALNLKDYEIDCKQVNLLSDGTVDYDELEKKITPKTKVVYIQRSRGYSLRPSISIEQTKKIIDISRKKNKNSIIIVDNCYCEFVEDKEPTEVGADLVCGSLIKNPGGGIAKTGGYIAGKKELVEACAIKLSAPGLGKEVGCNFNMNREMFMGIFLAPSTVLNAVKLSIFSRSILKKLNFTVFPNPEEKLTDIVSVLQLNSEQTLKTFCEGIQSGSPINSFVIPQAWDMPGYSDKIIMAAGTFTDGASIEISADAPLKEPYNVYLQGGLTLNSGKFCIMLALQKMLEKKLITP